MEELNNPDSNVIEFETFSLLAVPEAGGFQLPVNPVSMSMPISYPYCQVHSFAIYPLYT